MKPFALVIPYNSQPFFEETQSLLMASGLIDQTFIVAQEPLHTNISGVSVVVGRSISSGKTLNRILNNIRSEYLLLIPESKPFSFQPKTLEKFLQTAESTKAGLVYSDFYDQNQHKRRYHPLADYQFGSVRDDFDFGGMMLFSISAIQKALKDHGTIPEVAFAGLYDLRLKVSINHPIYHLKEPLYSMIETEESEKGERIFHYLDPRNRDAQKEMETIFTDHLKRIGAYLPPPLKEAEQTNESFPVEASVILPVKNRKETIEEAVRSALSQESDVPFNILVVDNHSTDGTTAILSNFVGKYSQLKHIIPERTDLGIGGCWNEALHHKACGRYAIQLDSDDLYSSPHTLKKIVNMLHQGNFAMVIGSYTVVDYDLKEIPPGLIDHREWTDKNGHNNALRINGLGAPRAYNTGLMRKIGFLNVSYGEDYAAALRICREYRIGRIYESLYLCRRWPGNTDAGLSLEEENQKNTFKDKIRTEEILTRQRIAKERERGDSKSSQ